mmetsp:Transcript_32005/g.58591  ORF Transcript_32005/g.58591 Transcript_32005/m.58591 type:complete len:98 (-) Transcript_32005:27-320(-)
MVCKRGKGAMRSPRQSQQRSPMTPRPLSGPVSAWQPPHPARSNINVQLGRKSSNHPISSAAAVGTSARLKMESRGDGIHLGPSTLLRCAQLTTESRY